MILTVKCAVENWLIGPQKWKQFQIFRWRVTDLI